jgi:hypothetical protein
LAITGERKNIFWGIAYLQNDYIKHYEVLRIEGGFALLYLKELAEPMPSDVVRNLADGGNQSLGKVGIS